MGLKREALACLQAAVGYPHNVAVRVGAVEALQAAATDTALPWIRAALMDEHPAVRFAACAAAGMGRDRSAEAGLRKCLDDEDASVRVAALFAWHRLGDSRRTGEMPTYLFEHEDPAVRRNAALLLGLLGEAGAIKVLARAMRDSDQAVRQHAIEAMARLGNREARQELTFMASSGIGSEEVFAIGALAQTADPRSADTFRYKLETATHLETKLAAARGLGLLGSDEGFELALGALDVRRPRIDDPADPPAGQILRIRQLAAAAVGAIGRDEALPALAKLLHDQSDPRVQVSAAGAILEILQR
jgi:HEAT repeat protein